MRNLLLILLMTSTLSASALQTTPKQECVTTEVERIDKFRVKVTTHDICKNVKVIKLYSKKEWDKIVADGKSWKERKKKAEKKRNKSI